MATLKLNGLRFDQVDKLVELSKGQDPDFWDFDGTYLTFPISQLYEVRQIVGFRPEWVDISDDVLSASMRYRSSFAMTRLIFETGDGDIVLNFKDQEMMELIADAGLAEIRDGRIVEWLHMGTDQDGAPIEKPYTPRICEWVDTGENASQFSICRLLVAYLMRKENRYYVDAHRALTAA